MSTHDHADPDRPWWATADPEVDRLDPGEDPLETTISARQRAEDGAEQGTETAGSTEGTSRQQNDADAEADTEATEVCGVCPLCTGWRYLRQHHPDVAAHLAAAGRHVSDVHPDVVDHLAAAGRHLASALRQALDDRGETAGADRTEPDGSSGARAETRSRSVDRDRFERIDLDDGQGQV